MALASAPSSMRQASNNQISGYYGLSNLMFLFFLQDSGNKNGRGRIVDMVSPTETYDKFLVYKLGRLENRFYYTLIFQAFLFFNLRV